jgi:Family of unknown function (DUF6152)
MPRFSAVLGSVLLVMLSPAFAHHSFAMFDQSKKLTLKGAVTEFQWTNPHAFIHLEVTDAAGKKDVWAIELNSPNNLKRQGWKSTSLKAGDQVTLTTYPLRDMSDHKGGLFVSVTLADGTVLGEAAFAGGSGPVNVPELPAK